MKNISEYLSDKRIKELVKDPYKKYIDEIHKRVNLERTEAGYKRLPWIVIKLKVNHLSLEDLDFLFKKCSHSFNFSKCFFGLLKVKK
jgi:hypothetical protein